MGSSTNQENILVELDDFSSSLLYSLREMKEQNDFLDVSLSCSEDQVVQCHKVVLSAASSYFRGVLKRHPASNPILIMPEDVQFSDLCHLIDFIYNGQLRIDESDLNSLLALGQKFKVKGLADDKLKVSGTRVALPPSQVQPSKTVPKLPPSIQMIRHGSGPSLDQQQRVLPQQQSHQVATTIPKSQKRYRPNDERDSPIPAKNFQNFGGKPNDPEVSEADHADEDVEGAYVADYDETGDFENKDSGSTYGVPPPPALNVGRRLMGLLCPNCHVMCPSVEELKSHLSIAHPDLYPQSHQQQQQHRVQPKEAVPATCEICDKTFKNAKYMLAHKKRLHFGFDEKKKAKVGRKHAQDFVEEYDDYDIEDQQEPPRTSNPAYPSQSHRFEGHHKAQQWVQGRPVNSNQVKSGGAHQSQRPQAVTAAASKPTGGPRSAIELLGQKLGGQISIISTETSKRTTPALSRTTSTVVASDGAESTNPPSHMNESSMDQFETAEEEEEYEGDDEDYMYQEYFDEYEIPNEDEQEEDEVQHFEEEEEEVSEEQ